MSINVKRSSRQRGTSRGADKFGILIEDILHDLVISWGIGISIVIKSWFSRKAWWAIPVSLLYSLFSFWVAKSKLPLVLWVILMPSVQQGEVWQYFYSSMDEGWHYLLVGLLLFGPVLYTLGFFALLVRNKYMAAFASFGLLNRLGDAPKLIYKSKNKQGRRRLVFDGNGVSVKRFEDCKAELEGLFNSNVESISIGSRKNYVVLTLSDQLFPEKVTYLDLAKSKSLPKESFYLGESSAGIEVQGLTELPHLLIAGTTGSGKSVFFKQALLGLLESSPYIQMYLIDLKGGLEMIDFAASPNVKVIKTMEGAVSLLKAAKKEMMKRFDYLEKSGKKQLRPGVDKKDRILIAVDEASVLYMNRPRTDPEYHLAIEARTLADTIAKLSRASAIHLLFATQKLDRQVIPTSVSENISGRMAFRANSLQGSMVVLGNKSAYDIPEVPGRAVWQFGNREITVQAPLVDEKTIESRCRKIAKMH